MSFILDALKKAESERSRNSGPVLMDVRIAPPRRRLPAWAWLLGGVLLANLLVLAWLLLRKPAPAPGEVAARIGAEPAPSGAQSAAPPPATAAPMQPAASEAAAQPPAPEVDVDALPTMQDLLASGVSLRPLQLNLHVYDPSPANRFVLLNSMRLREGEQLPDGTRVERITARGAVINVNGRRFLLLAGG